MNNIGLNLNISGTVQGIGFRPFLYKLALELNLNGEIKNNSAGVSAYFEGKRENLQFFIDHLTKTPPQNAKIEDLSQIWVDPKGLNKLTIVRSEVSDTKIISTPPDLSTCNKCYEEFSNPKDRRFNYPLISCTNCGPRYSITFELPFDRERTSYKNFPLCNDCLSEYQNAQDRRHHAQTTGCASCGPNIFFWPKEFEVNEFLLSGKILGLKGVGGFQIICNARDLKSIQKLRERKNRPHRPLAVMAKSLKHIKKICELTLEEEKLITSNIAPIVILEAKNDLLPKEVSPDTNTIGFFLPTTPLHQMLFKNGIDFLIVTSGNEKGSPIGTNDEEGIKSFVDGIISHNRPILSRCDDSVYQGIDLIRPGRGIAPLSFTHSKKINKTILSLGADLKNTICISRENKSYLSPHIGDLFNYPTFLDFKKQIANFCNLLKAKPEVIAIDLHPNYFSSIFGKELAKEKGIKLIEVAHHHAHALAAMEEHSLNEAYAFTFDGTGFGTDGTLWGGELLHLFHGGFKRISSLMPFLLPGGEKAIKDPKRQLDARFVEMGIEIEDILLKQILKQKINTFKTSSVGRLFDQVSALLEIQQGPITYEGQAAILLETEALKSNPIPKAFKFIKNDLGQIDTKELLKEILAEKNNGAPIPVLAYRFHYTMAKIALCMLDGLKPLPIVFCGGVFQNKLLSSLLDKKLKGEGFKIFKPHQIPINDAGISFGQAIYCRQLME